MKTPLLFLFIIYNFIQIISYAQQPILKLTVEGVDPIETQVIDSIGYTNSFQNFVDLTSEIDSLQKVLVEAGYLDLAYKRFQRTSDSTVTSYFELNTKYNKLRITYDPKIIPKELLLKIASDVTDTQFSIPYPKIKEILQYLTNQLVDQGNTFSNLQLTHITKKENIVFAKLESTLSKTRVIDKVLIKGYHKFPPSYLKHYSKIKTGTVFSKKQILSKSKRIENLPFAKNIKPPDVLFNKDSTTVYLYLEKQSANTFDGFLGFSSDPESGNLELNGYLDVNLINNLNYGERLSIIYKSDGNEQQRFQGNISLPYLLKTPLGIEASIDIFKKDSTFLITEQAINLNYLIDAKNSLFAGFKASSSNELLDIPQPLLNIDDYTSSFFRVGFNHSTLQNNNLFPIKNRYTITTEFGSRKTDLETISQIKGAVNLSYTIDLNQRNSIFLNNSAVAVFSDNLFTNELFRFGGINSIKGFEENSLNASLYNVFNSEYRYLLSSNLYIHSIIDYSYFEDDSANLSDNLTSFGFGIGLYTQTGLFRIIFANGKDSAQNFRFSNTKVHLSLSAKF